jgi:glycosyltransferase involved in cell wall biosynthesis
MNAVLVSVYIPTHNRRALLERALASVLEQSHACLEAIVVDDGSTDSTGDFLAEVARSDPRVVVLRNQTPQGACFSRNRGILQSRGRFVTGLDDDDFFLPDRLGRFLEAWNGDCLGLYSDVELVQPTGRKRIRKAKECDFNALLSKNVVGNQAFLPADIAKSTAFDSKLSIWQDLDYWLGITRGGGSLRNIGHATMIVDAMHGAARISAANARCIDHSIEVITKKYELTKRQEHVLTLQKIKFYRAPRSFSSALKIARAGSLGLGSRALLAATKTHLAGAARSLVTQARNGGRHPAPASRDAGEGERETP